MILDPSPPFAFREPVAAAFGLPGAAYGRESFDWE